MTDEDPINDEEIEDTGVEGEDDADEVDDTLDSVGTSTILIDDFVVDDDDDVRPSSSASYRPSST